MKAVESCFPKFEASSAILVLADAVASSSFARCGAQVLARRRGQFQRLLFRFGARARRGISRPRCVADAIESHDGSSEESNGFQPPMAFVGGLARPSSAMAR